MSSNFDNRRRAFADVVSIDAWHDPFGSDAGAVDLHADIVFGTARVGGEPESAVRFRLSIKRAELVVIIPETEPVKIDRNSVARGAKGPDGKMVETFETSAQGHMKAVASSSIGPTNVSGATSAEIGAAANIQASKKIEITATVEFMKVTQSKTADDNYRWTIEPGQQRTLDGRPWDGVKEPRLKLIDLRANRSKGIPPSVRVEVRCRREDLAIEELEAKDVNAWQLLTARAGFSNRLAAAESYIRDRLAEEGFQIRNLEEKFAELVLGAVTAEFDSGSHVRALAERRTGFVEC